MPGEIMMVSIDFVKQSLKLIDLLIPDFVMTMVSDFVNEKPGPL